MSGAVKVEFPEGVREIVSEYWTMKEDLLTGREFVRKPTLKIPGYRVEETIDGRYIACPDPH